MKQLGDGMPYELVSERADVSVPVLKKHYDHRSMKWKQSIGILYKMSHQDSREKERDSPKLSRELIAPSCFNLSLPTLENHACCENAD